MKQTHVLVISNRWFSAVTDYCLQLATYLQQNNNINLIICAQPDSPIIEKTKHLRVSYSPLPWRSQAPWYFVKCWLGVNRLLAKLANIHSKNIDCVFWVFEGREHTLCALHRLLQPSSWRNCLLVRVRGQAAIAKNNLQNRWLYLQKTDKIVFASAAIANAFPYSMPPNKATVQLYCTNSVNPESLQHQQTHLFSFLPNCPNIDFSRPTYLVVGRYDPVKGHSWLLESFALLNVSQLPTNEFVQLIFVGQSKNVQASALHAQGVTLLGQGFANGTRFYATSSDSRKRLFIFDEHVPEAKTFMKRAHYGVIPSLGSEVICRVAVEFLQNGTPLIVSNVGALAETVSNAPASVVEPKNTQELSRTLEKTLSNAINHEKMPVLRRQATIAGEQFALARFDSLLKFLVSTVQ